MATIMSSPPPAPLPPIINLNSTPLRLSSPQSDPMPISTSSTSTSTAGRPSPPTRTRSSSVLHKNVISRMRPLPFQYIYSFWHTKPTSCSTPTLLAASVPDIAAFYKIHNNFPFASLPAKSSIHFFRAGVRPLWEDAENIAGGCWTFKVRKVDAANNNKDAATTHHHHKDHGSGGDGSGDSKALRTWEELCLMVLGGELQAALVAAAERDHILGISFSPRAYGSIWHIQIWTKQGRNMRSVEVLKRTVMERLSEELRPREDREGECCYYKRHDEHEGWAEVVGMTRTCSSSKEARRG